jgi:hypothetical protein
MMIEIDRVDIALAGVSALVAEQAAAGLEAELRRRLGSVRAGITTDAVPELSVGPLELPPAADATALRTLIAQHLIEALMRPSAREPARRQDGESA